MKCFGMALGSWVPWKISARIRALAFLLDKIVKGDFSQPPVIAQDDLIDELGKKINSVAVSFSEQKYNGFILGVNLESLTNPATGPSRADKGRLFLKKFISIDCASSSIL